MSELDSLMIKDKHIKSSKTSKHLPKFQDEVALLNDLVKESADRTELIEVLSRLGTLLKLLKIDINIVEDNSNDFQIIPGESIELGKDIVSNSFLTLLILRYGLEWQLWFKAQEAKNPNMQICNVAAEIVVSEYLKLIPQKNKLAIHSVYSKKVNKLIQNIENPERNSLEGLLNNEKTNNISVDEFQTLQLLSKPSEYLLIYGGDTRLKVKKEELLNKYGCRPFPRPEAYTFASSTASSISSIAFEKVEKKRFFLIKKSLQNGSEHTAKTFFKDLKDHLQKSLVLPKNTSFVFAPSGTDACLQMAGICQTVTDKDIVHILVASEETGSGVAMALEGKHFSDSTANEVQVKKGDKIKGFRTVRVEKIALRDEQGVLKTENIIDNEVYDAVKKAFKEGKQPVLHIMKQSKLGYSAPSDDLLKKLDDEYGQDLLKLIDNSQLRLGRKKIADYLKKGFMMTITGSKFFTGPPFSGTLLIPGELHQKWSKVDKNLPLGLKDYFYKDAWPENWRMIDELEDGTNYGTALRWYASLIEIDRYFQTPTILRKLGSEKFCSYVDQLITQTNYLEHLSSTSEDCKKSGNRTGRTIFPFYIKKNGQVLTEAEAKKVYELLNVDLSDKLENLATKRYIGSQLCHIGQPVQIKYKDGKTTGVLRINLGARVISESWKARDVGIFFQQIKEQINQVNIIVRKIEIILENPDWLK